MSDAFAPLLAKSPAPRIVNVTSVAGSLNYASTLPPDDLRAGFMVYSASYVFVSLTPTFRTLLRLRPSKLLT